MIILYICYLKLVKMITRILTEKLLISLQKGRVTALYGARRTGKTTILNMVEQALQRQKNTEATR